MANKKDLSITSIDKGRWQGTQWCFCSPSCLMSPRSNTKIVGGTGDQRATIHDCTRFWMSCATQTKWTAPFKITSEVSKEGSVVTNVPSDSNIIFQPCWCYYCWVRRKYKKRFLIIQTSSSCAFSKDKHKFYTWIWEWTWDSIPPSTKMFMRYSFSRRKKYI